MSKEEFKGFVKWMSKSKGYGFIIPDKMGSNLFFHISDCDFEGTEIYQGDKVEYTIEEEIVNGDKKIRAIDVKIIKEGGNEEE